MSLDTKYRPRTYADVLGQESTVSILKHYVSTGAGFHQSYLFAGPYGSGKTTVGRILARALLCATPREGEPCDSCPSCKSMLEGGSAEGFFEIDAATNSGKDSIREIVAKLQYSTFSGKGSLYLMDESHRLSADALDALLKPLEDNAPGSEDKLLTCIFCTTEPERMRATILSRCAPAFIIKPVQPIHIAERLARVCEAEGYRYDMDALVLIGEITECHIRDALKAVEGVSMVGDINMANVSQYLHLDHSTALLGIIAQLKDDVAGALAAASGLLETMSPITAYERTAEMAMLAFRAGLDPKLELPSYMRGSSIREVGARLGPELLGYAERLASRPGRPTASMYLCDLAQLSRGVGVGQPIAAPPTVPAKIAVTSGKVVAGAEQPKPVIVDDVYVDPRAVRVKTEGPPPEKTAGPAELKPLEFLGLVRRRYLEFGKEPPVGGQERRDDVGRAGVDPPG